MNIFHNLQKHRFFNWQIYLILLQKHAFSIKHKTHSFVNLPPPNKQTNKKTQGLALKLLGTLMLGSLWLAILTLLLHPKGTTGFQNRGPSIHMHSNRRPKGEKAKAVPCLLREHPSGSFPGCPIQCFYPALPHGPGSVTQPLIPAGDVGKCGHPAEHKLEFLYRERQGDLTLSLDQVSLPKSL